MRNGIPTVGHTRHTSVPEGRIATFEREDGSLVLKTRFNTILHVETDEEAKQVAAFYVETGQMSESGAQKALEARANGYRSRGTWRLDRILNARSDRAERAQATRLANLQTLAQAQAPVRLTTQPVGRKAQPVRAARVGAPSSIEVRLANIEEMLERLAQSE